jgi:hypothetical protein
MRALTGMLFLGCEYAATPSADQYLLSASVATVVNATADPCVERRQGEDSDMTPITGINKASKVERRTVGANGATASG